MRRMISLQATIALVTLMLVTCSSNDPLAFDLAQPMEPPPAPVTITGAAVDEGIVCASGMFVDSRMEDVDGNPLDPDGWFTMFDSAIESEGVAEAMSINDYRCDDGSGTITVTQHVRFDFSEISILVMGNSTVDTGTWTLEGTGDYETLIGSGDLVQDGSEQMIHMVGEIEA